MKMQVYAHATNNNSQFSKGVLMGAGSGIVAVVVLLTLAYVLDIVGIHHLIDGLFHSMASGNWRL